MCGVLSALCCQPLLHFDSQMWFKCRILVHVKHTEMRLKLSTFHCVDAAAAQDLIMGVHKPDNGAVTL